MDSRLPTLVVDTREPEHTAYRFDPERCNVVRAKLDSADYSVLGHEDEWGIERKELGDFVNTVIRARGRFEEELERLLSFRFRRIVIEATPRDVTEHSYRSMVHPNSVLGSAYALETDYDCPIIWAGNRKHGELITQGLLIRLWRRDHEERRSAELWEHTRYLAGE
jgi:ERCC4-type nuclease